MKERPILFSAPMVRAILNGRKTQTRRVVKGGLSWLDDFEPGPVGPDAAHRCPYGVPGDRLWVRETWSAEGCCEGEAYYRATAIEDGLLYGEVAEIRWRPSIHMPRWASRLALEIVGVRVERLKDCSKGDAEAEGLVRLPATGRYAINKGDQYFGAAWFDPCEAYRALWEQINGEGSWDANPWVWVVEFRRLDALTATAA